MDNDKITEVHQRPATGMREIHRQYGLWIFRGGTNDGMQPDTFLSCSRRYFDFYSISHMYDGGGRLWLAPDCESEITPGDCVLIMPGSPNRYGGFGGKCYSEDTVNFWGPVADLLRRSGIIRDGVFPMGRVRRLLPILQYRADPAVDAQIRANIELQKLLTDIYLERQRHVHSEYPLLDELLRSIREHPGKWWTVREMAEMCNLSCDQMRRVFTQRTGVTPKLYVDKLKLNLAADQLLRGRQSIAEIALRFGYIDQYHFSRRFKAVMGLSPRQYRIQAGAAMGSPTA